MSKRVVSMGLMAIVMALPSPAQSVAGRGAEVGEPVATSARIYYSGRMLGYLRQQETGDPTTRSDAAKYFLQGYSRECRTQSCVLLGMGDNFSPDYPSRLDNLGRFKSRADDASINSETDNVAIFLKAADFSALVPGKEDFYHGAYRLWKIADGLNESRSKGGTVGPFIADNLSLSPAGEKAREPWKDSKRKFTTHFEGISTSFSGHAMPWLVKLNFSFEPAITLDEAKSLTGTLCEANENPDDFRINPKHCERWIAEVQQTTDKIKTWDFYRWDPGNPGTLAFGSYLEGGADYGFCVTGGTLQPGKGNPDYGYCLPIHVEFPAFKTPYVLATDPVDHTDVAVFSVVDPEIRSYMPKQNIGWDITGDKGNVLKNSEKQKSGAWLPHRIEINTLPPQDALQQALDAFAFYHPYFRGITVVMAQMDYASADELARHLKAPKGLQLGGGGTAGSEPAFDLVIARADFAHETRRQSNTLSMSAGSGRPHFLAVPPPAFNEDTKQVQLPLGWVDLSRAATSASVEFWISDSYCSPGDHDLEGCLAAAKPGQSSSAWKDLLDKLQTQQVSGPYSDCLARKKLPPNHDACQKDTSQQGIQKIKDLKTCLLEFATCAMLKDNERFDIEGSDLAVLQIRDAWVPGDKANDIQLAYAPTVQGILDRIFWKDDLLSHANLSGSQLKTLIKESAAIEKNEKNPLWIVHDTTGRGLTYSGFLAGNDPKPGSKDTSYYSRLDEISDSSLYRIAASSYISNGDTGYAEFATPAGGKEEFFRKDTTGNHEGKNKTGVRISVLVCETLAGADVHSPVYSCGETGVAKSEEAQSTKQPSNCGSGETIDETCYAVAGRVMERIPGLLVRDNREQDSPSEYIEAQVRELVIGRDPFVERNKVRLADKTQIEKQLQSYPYLDVNLAKLAIAGNLNTALATRAETANFGGVLQSDIPQPTKSEFSWFTSLRVLDRRAHGKWDFGGAIDEQFDKSVQGSLTKPSSPGWLYNTLVVGPIIQYSFSDPRTPPRRLFTVHLMDYNRQITSTDISLSGHLNSASFTLIQRPSFGFQPKGGYRYESGDSYLEIGGVYVRNYDVLSEIAGLPGGDTCDISSKVSLSTCVSQITFTPPLATPILHYSHFSQSGIYWDSKFDLDVIKGKWSYEFATKGNYYFAGDMVSALTRLDARVSNSLKFPLFGNFSLAPVAEWRFFETEGTRDFLKRINTSVALTYNFHKDSRVGLWGAMKYKPTAAAQ